MTESISFNEYQTGAALTAIYPSKGSVWGLMYAGLEAANEAGEVAGKIKKIVRKHDHVTIDLGNGHLKSAYSQDFTDALIGEVGDALWGLAQVCTEAGITLEEAAWKNLAKLSSRAERGVLEGDGDDR